MSTADVLAIKGKKKGHEVASLPLQETSLDIWDKKYRLKTKDGTPVDGSVDETFARVARALADVEADEATREHWHREFLWALRQGAIPAGRITSNAGALAHKPATSTINCTVSGTIVDSMDDILSKVHEAGLTLKAGCVAPGTTVVTERGHVPVERAVAERHERILSYDKDAARFEMRRIEKHMTTTVEREDNIEIRSNGTRLSTSCRHPRAGLPARQDAVRARRRRPGGRPPWFTERWTGRRIRRPSTAPGSPALISATAAPTRRRSTVSDARGAWRAEGRGGRQAAGVQDPCGRARGRRTLRGVLPEYLRQPCPDRRHRHGRRYRRVGTSRSRASRPSRRLTRSITRSAGSRRGSAFRPGFSRRPTEPSCRSSRACSTRTVPSRRIAARRY